MKTGSERNVVWRKVASDNSGDRSFTMSLSILLTVQVVPGILNARLLSGDTAAEQAINWSAWRKYIFYCRCNRNCVTRKRNASVITFITPLAALYVISPEYRSNYPHWRWRNRLKEEQRLCAVKIKVPMSGHLCVLWERNIWHWERKMVYLAKFSCLNMGKHIFSLT